MHIALGSRDAELEVSISYPEADLVRHERLQQHGNQETQCRAVSYDGQEEHQETAKAGVGPALGCTQQEPGRKTVAGLSQKEFGSIVFREPFRRS